MRWKREEEDVGSQQVRARRSALPLWAAHDPCHYAEQRRRSDDAATRRFPPRRIILSTWSLHFFDYL